MPIPKSILERIATFGRNLDSYVHPDDAGEPLAPTPKPAEYTEQAKAQAAHMFFAKEDPPKP